MQALAFLLRGINVGGSGRLPMATLRDLAGGLGMSDVRTYIQSGNLVARWDGDPRTAADALAAAIAGAAGFTPAVLVRTGQEMRDVLTACPFPAEGVDPSELHVTFLETEADAAAVVAALDRAAFTPERAVAVGRELHLHLPNGAGRSPLAATLARTPPASRSTTRNWRTVTKLVAMLGDLR